MRSSVVIVNYRSWDSLAAGLETLGAASSAASPSFEIIVVDNDSADGRLGEFEERFPRVRFLVAAGNLGFAHACNTGAAAAAGEELIFLNPDVRARPEDIEALLSEKDRHPEYALLSATQTDSRGRARKAGDRFPGPLSSVPALRALLRLLRPTAYPSGRLTEGSHSEPVPLDWLSGSLLLVSRADLERIGGWNENYWLYYEDVDLCLRAKRRGMRAACTTRVGVVHQHGGASRRDEATSVLTRTEVIISRHLYVHNNFAGWYRAFFHASLLTRELIGLALAALINLLTLSQLSPLRVRTGVLAGIARHLAAALRQRSWQSPRASGQG